MRTAILSLMATLWLTSSPAFSRNGETGILVIKSYDVQTDGSNHRSIFICEEDWAIVSEIIDQGQPAQVYLENLGTYIVDKTSQGELRLTQVDESPTQDHEDSFSLLSHQCPISKSDDAC